MKVTFKDLCELNNKFNFIPKRNVEVLAFIRFAKEDLTFKQCLNSLLPAITKGVLVYHDQPNGSSVDISKTIEIAKEFCEQNPGFKLIHYPHIVYHANSEKYMGELGKDYEKENCLDAFYNFTLEELKKLAKTSDPYLLKVDGDHIYDSTSISEQIEILNESPIIIDELYLPKVNVCYLPQEDKLYFLRSLDCYDHFFVRANRISFKFSSNKETKCFWEVQTPDLNNKYIIDAFLKNNEKLFDDFFLAIEEKNNFQESKFSFKNLYKKYKLNKNYNKKRQNLITAFKNFTSRKYLVNLQNSSPKYNSLHFHLQKYWEYPYGEMPTLEEFKQLSQFHDGKYVEFSEWVDPNNTSNLSLFKSGLIDRNSQPNHYFIQNYEKVLETARSFYKK